MSDHHHLGAIRSDGSVFVRFSHQPVSYPNACEGMEGDVQRHKDGDGPEVLWFLQHPALYTYGIRTNRDHIDMARKTGLPVYLSKRGGLLTYHSPGQRIVYAVMHLRQRGLGVVDYISMLQQWVINALKRCDIDGFIVPDFVGVWTTFGKIASIGVRVSGGISSHGLAINVSGIDPSKERGFGAIVPCGLANIPVAAVQDINPLVGLNDLDSALLATNPFSHPV